MQSFKDLKVGMRVKLKKLEECKETETLYKMSLYSRKEKFAGRIVTVVGIDADGDFQVEELRVGDCVSFSSHWIESIVQPEKSVQSENVEKFEDFKFRWNEKVEKLKPGDLVRFPSEERYRELLKDGEWKHWHDDYVIKGIFDLYGNPCVIEEQMGELWGFPCYKLKDVDKYRFPSFIFERIEKFRDLKGRDFVKVESIQKTQNFKNGDIVKVVKIDEDDDQVDYQKTLGMVGEVEYEHCDVTSVYFRELDLSFDYSPNELQKVEKIQELKVGMRVKLKKLEECGETETLPPLSGTIVRKGFAEKIVTISGVNKDGDFEIKENSSNHKFSPEWIDHIVQPEKSLNMEKYEFLENFNKEDYENKRREVFDSYDMKVGSNYEKTLESKLEHIKTLKENGYFSFVENGEMLRCYRYETILEYLARLEREERVKKLK